MNPLDRRGYAPEEKEEICHRILAGVAAGRSVASVLREDGMPAAGTFWMWHLNSVQLQDELARARINGVEVHLEEINDIVDGTDIPRNPDGTMVNPLDGYLLDPQRAKMRADFRLKRAQMIAPRKYGPKLDLTTDGKALGDSAPSDSAERAVELLKRVEGRTRPAVIDSRLDDLLS